MIMRKLFLFLFVLQPLCADQGYVEICNKKQDAATFDRLYGYFDELIDFLQRHPAYEQKLYSVKERFIRSTGRAFYSTDFFGYYAGKDQISFYYSTHFHEYACSYCPELKQVQEIIQFFDACRELQEPYGQIFNDVADEFELDVHPSTLLKVIKYLPSYEPTRPHYDGTLFSLFLDSTDNESLLLSAYKPSYTVDDFSSPQRSCSDSILLIPGALLANPTPHIVTQSGKTRYSVVAFAMRPNHTPQKVEFSPLPNFKNIGL